MHCIHGKRKWLCPEEYDRWPEASNRFHLWRAVATITAAAATVPTRQEVLCRFLL
jgi:hypothetical protein